MKTLFKTEPKRRLWQAGSVLGMAVLGLSMAAAQEKPARTTTAPTSAEVVGQVVSPEGKPIPNAAVSWIERAAIGGVQRRLVADTDAQGRFRFPEALPGADSGRSVMLLVQAPGLGIGFQGLPRGPGAAAPLTITLSPSLDLKVTFTDQAGKPLPALPVRVNFLYAQDRGFLEIPAAMHGRWEQKTDAGGVCVFPGLPQGAQVRFAVESEGYATLSYEDAVTLGRDATTQQAGPIRLLPAGVVQGHVSSIDGKPAAGIRVGAQAAGIGDGWGETVTDANGSYRIGRLRPGSYNIALYLHGEQEKNLTARALEKREVKGGATLERQDFLLIKGTLITGKVTDKSSGKPLSGVMIGIYGPAHPRSGAAVQNATTGPDGVYQAHVPAGAQYVYVMGQPSNRYEVPREGANVTVGEDAALTQDFALLPALAQNLKPVHGHVVGPDSKPVSKAKILVIPVSADASLPGGQDIEADESGAFTLEMKTASVRLRARSGILATEKTTLAQSGENITLPLKPGVLIALVGQVMNDKGQPIPNAKVMLIEWWLDTGLGNVTAMTDAQGRFHFSGLFPDARYSVTAEAAGYGSQGTQPEEYLPGEVVRLHYLQLPRADSFIAGRVVDENGEPVVRQTIRVQGLSSKAQEVFTDAQGRFRCEGLVKETLVLYLNDNNGFSPNPKRVQAGDTDIILVHKSSRPQEKENEEKQNNARKQQRELLQKPGPALRAAAWLNTTTPMPEGLKGKIVLIDFWAVSCGPCVASLPAVQKVSEQYAGRNVVVVGLHASGMERVALLDFVKARKLTYPIAVDTDDPRHETFGQIMSSYGVLGIPTVAVLDRAGTVRYLDFGLEGALKVIGDLLASEK